MNIGIIIPYYENNGVMKDRLEWLLEILKYQLKDDVEVVIVDDGSNAYWLDKYSKWFSIIHLKQNKGVSNARNVGLEYLLSENKEYIGFLDADDCISSDYLKEAKKLMKKGYDFIDNRFVQEGLEIFGTLEGLKRLKGIRRGGVAGTFIKSSIIGDIRFDEKLQIGEDVKFVNDVLDLSKHKKGVSMGIYVYNKGINTDSLTMKHARGEISEKYTQDFLTKEYYKYQDMVDSGKKTLEFTYNELGANGISINQCFEFGDKMNLLVEMPSPDRVAFRKKL